MKRVLSKTHKGASDPQNWDLFRNTP